MKHGLHALEGAVRRFGSETWLEVLGEDGAALLAWRDELVDDLGGEERVTAAQRALVDTACRCYLYLEHIDRYCLSKGVIINKQKHTLFPVAIQRQKYADSLGRTLALLGLERRQPSTHDLTAYVEETYGNGGKGRGDE